MIENTVFARRPGTMLLVLILLLQCWGCSSTVSVHKEIRASIDQNSDWKMSERCTDDDCTVLADFLTSKDMTIKIELDNDQQTKHFFVIRTDFTTVKIQAEYNPAKSVAMLKTGETLKPKAFTCYYIINDLEYLRNRPSQVGSFPIKKSDCYMLFFDYPVLSGKDEIILDLNEAFSVSGKRLAIPLIRFKKSVDNK